MPENTAMLTNNHLFWIVIIGMVSIAASWCVTFFVVRKNDEQVKALIHDGNLVRMLTVIFVVFATSILAIMGAMNEAVSAIFAGIVGYVLGSMNNEKTKKDALAEDNPTSN